MASVWYIGRNDERQIFGQSFSRHNGWSIPEAVFTNAQRVEMDADQSFLLGQADGPRSNPPPMADGTPDPAWPYYKAIQDIYDELVENGASDTQIASILANPGSAANAVLAGTYVQIPSGGTNGQALIKAGPNVVWATVEGDIPDVIYDGGIL